MFDGRCSRRATPQPSKTCSAGGVVKARLRPSTRIFSCHACGLRLDRDRNTARNLAWLVLWP
ncbi:zinc ribbon domain-containing protein [Haloactinospora alba]|uniref:zinc ribbon domain-containing protein n=1 Tax=Haloactinospora alba TaxID=405555 RepID=UPI00114D9B07|nr:zinc ribbon domain-containing protein [Haloactinospora alba]